MAEIKRHRSICNFILYRVIDSIGDRPLKLPVDGRDWCLFGRWKDCHIYCYKWHAQYDVFVPNK